MMRCTALCWLKVCSDSWHNRKLRQRAREANRGLSCYQCLSSQHDVQARRYVKLSATTTSVVVCSLAGAPSYYTRSFTAENPLDLSSAMCCARQRMTQLLYCDTLSHRCKLCLNC